MTRSLERSTEAGQWLRTFAHRPAATRQLLCFPHAGGSASAFRALALAAPADLEVIAVQYPGRQDRADVPMPNDLTVLAEQIHAAVGADVRRNTAFFGHSMGAVVAFEVARRLRPRFPAPLARLYVSACKAPSDFADRETVPDEAGIREYLQSLGGTDPTVLDDSDIWQITLRTMRGDLAAIHRYRYAPGAPLGCAITAVAGAQDPAATADDMRRWRELTVSGFTAHTVPGGHFYLDEQLDPVLRLLSEAGRPG